MSFDNDLLENMDQARKMRELLSLLDSREEQILRLRFGIGEPSSYTLEEVGDRFGISRERVRQIEEKALDKLKVQPRAIAIYGESPEKVKAKELRVKQGLNKRSLSTKS